jgi:hypothetical protein
MLKSQPRTANKWYDRLSLDEAQEVQTLEDMMRDLEQAYRRASKRREFLQRRALARSVNPAERPKPNPVLWNDQRNAARRAKRARDRAQGPSDGA